MEPFRELGKMMFLVGLVLVAVGGMLAYGGKLPFRLGRLPGDIAWHGKGTSFYFPIVTCIVISLVISVVLWVVGMLRK